MSTKNILVENIEANAWNPNRIPQDLYENLKSQMIAEGDLGIDPIIVTRKNIYFADSSQPGDEYVIVDGEHRWRIAKELGWEDIRCEIWAVSEEEAKSVSYRRNKLRGSMDPYREADLFKSMQRELRTQEAVAEFFGVSRVLVTSRLAILKTSSEVREIYENVPRGTLTVSHLEAVASIKDPGARREIVSDIVDEELSVRHTESRVKQVKQRLEKEEDLRKAVEISEYKVCPDCEIAPTDTGFRGLPWVICRTMSCGVNSWNLETGATYPPKRAPPKKEEKTESVRQPPRSFRYPQLPKEISGKLTKRVLAFMKDVQSIENFRISGKIKVGEEVKEFSIDFDPAQRADSRMSYYESIGPWSSDRATSFSAEPKKYKVFTEKSLVHGNYSGNSHDKAVEHLEKLRRFIDAL